MMAVVGRMPLWAGENQDIYLAKSADVVDGVVVVETAMLTDSRAAEYRDTEGHQGGADEVSGHEEIEGAEPQGKNKNTDGAD